MSLKAKDGETPEKKGAKGFQRPASVVYQVSFPHAEAEELRKLADEEDRTISNFLRIVVRKGLAASGRAA